MQGGHPPNTKPKSRLHSRRPTHLNQKVHFGGKSTTNVLEPYIRNSINAILQQEAINNGCILQGAKYRQIAFHPSLAAHIVVPAYFHIFGGVNSQPFTPVEHSASNTIQELYSVTNKV